MDFEQDNESCRIYRKTAIIRLRYPNEWMGRRNRQNASREITGPWQSHPNGCCSINHGRCAILFRFVSADKRWPGAVIPPLPERQQATSLVRGKTMQVHSRVAWIKHGMATLLCSQIFRRDVTSSERLVTVKLLDSCSH